MRHSSFASCCRPPLHTLPPHAAAARVQDRRVGWLPRLVALLALAYALSPIDLLPDFIPVLGLIDDLLVLPGGWVAPVPVCGAFWRRRLGMVCGSEVAHSPCGASHLARGPGVATTQGLQTPTCLPAPAPAPAHRFRMQPCCCWRGPWSPPTCWPRRGSAPRCAAGSGAGRCCWRCMLHGVHWRALSAAAVGRCLSPTVRASPVPPPPPTLLPPRAA